MSRRGFDCNGNQNYFRGPAGGDRERDLENVAGAFDENFNVRVNAYIDGRDFCRAVRRCLLNDLVAGAMDDEDNNRHHKHN